MTNALVVVPGESRSSDFYKRLFQKLFSFFSFADGSDYTGTTSEPSYKSERAKKHFKKNFFFYIPIGIVILIILFVFFNLLTSDGNTGVKSITSKSDDRVSVKKPLASQSLNKTYSFPIKDTAGKEVSKMKMSVSNVEIRDEIVVKGQKATAVEGKVFLVVNIKITNDYSKALQIISRDYFRLSVNNSQEMLAADVHNDPVEVQAISTKYTRIGFPINETDKNLILHIGEINGKKQEVKLNLQK